MTGPNTAALIGALLAAGLVAAATEGRAQPARPEPTAQAIARHKAANAAAAARLQRAIEDIHRRDATIPGVMAAVSAPRLDVEWEGATGSL
ncbi:hypothetical protein, partial [Phenylobacterium sp.]|uniref:hypothetical protein n=1 Tax=Phenylobacterium sp. TaxID=1871053 RepID=UPI003784ABFD